MLSLAGFAAGLLVHAYLPLRASALFASADHGIDNVVWGDARTWRGFWWVVSAQTFAEKTAVVHGNASPWDLPFLPIEELGTLVALLAPAGAYLLLRRAASRVIGVSLLVGSAGAMAAALVGGMDPSNPIFAATWDRPSRSWQSFLESQWPSRSPSSACKNFALSWR